MQAIALPILCCETPVVHDVFDFSQIKHHFFVKNS